MRFNSTVQDMTETTNHENGVAYKPSIEMELYLRTVSSLLSDSFYTKASAELKSLQELIKQNDQTFVLQLANYARNVMMLRTVPQVLLAGAATRIGNPNQNTRSLVNQYVPKIVRRADEPAELLSYWINHLGGGHKANLPNALKKGLSSVYATFTEYDLAKYNRKGQLKQKDIFALVHPKPQTPEQSDLFKRVLEDKLTPPDTWEVFISTNGSSAENWNKIAPKMGIMALIRNLSNFEKHGAEQAIDLAIQKMTDKQTVLTSKLLPFRWLAAERSVKSQRLKDALRQAVQLSVENTPRLSGHTTIVVDNSGSMHSPLSNKSSLDIIDVASLLGALAVHICDDYQTIAFGTKCKTVELSKWDSVLTNAQKIKAQEVGQGTYAHVVMEELIQNKQKTDRIIFLSDMQCYGRSTLQQQFSQYLRKVNPSTVLYSIDLKSYGTLQFPMRNHNVVTLGGYSERLLDLITFLEKGDSVLDYIKQNF